MKIKELLGEYKINEIKIKDIDIEIEFIKQEIGLKALEYKEAYSMGGGNNSSIVENIVINNDIKIERLELQKERIKNRQNKIGNIMNIVSEDERRIIELKHFSDFKCTWDMISERMNMSYSAVRSVYNRALKRIDSLMLIAEKEQF